MSDAGEPSAVLVAWTKLDGLSIGIDAKHVDAIHPADDSDHSELERLDLAELLGLSVPERERKTFAIQAGGHSFLVLVGAEVQMKPVSTVHVLPPLLRGLEENAALAGVTPVGDGFGYILDADRLASFARSQEQEEAK